MKVYVKDMQVFTSIGTNIQELLQNLYEGKQSIHPLKDKRFSDNQFFLGALYEEQKKELNNTYGATTPYFTHQLTIKLIEQLVQSLPTKVNDDSVIILLSSTKGNVQNLSHTTEDVTLTHLGACVKEYFNLKYCPKVYSTACISGTQAIIQAQRYLQKGKFKYAIVIGIDELTPFVFKGFSSFHAIEQDYCKPFDLNRNGINLGEAGAGLLLSNIPNEEKQNIIIAGGGLSNDANHLSGPSKTGEELAHAIRQAVNEADLMPSEVALISAHGTATAYNDEMESKALQLSQVAHAPVYSLKSYTGHTLGAAGVLETIVGIGLMKDQKILKSLNFSETGTPITLQVITKTQDYTYSNFLKTASGFGGCNAALVCKIDD